MGRLIWAAVFALAVLLLGSVPTPSCFAAAAAPVTVVRAKPMPEGESAGARPYEMVWANRKPPRTPLVNFDSLDGWTLECVDGAMGELVGSQKQRVWESPVARLVYRGTTPKSAVILRPPKPQPIAEAATAATIWICGNNWGWAADPSTPQVSIDLLFADSGGKERQVNITRVRWKEWWLVHKALPEDLRKKAPLRFIGIRVGGCANKEDRELYFEDLCFFTESLRPLTFASRPARGVDPFPGQSPGANRGPGRLPFPTREETILPDNLATAFTTQLVHPQGEQSYTFVYKGPDVRLEYEIRPVASGWGPIAVKLDGVKVAEAMADGGVLFSEAARNTRLSRAEARGGVLHGEWQCSLGDSDIVIASDVRLWQKSLVVDYICRGGDATELSYGYIAGVEKPELILLPYLNYGGHHLNLMMARGAKPFFASVWMDWYRSNASAPYAVDSVKGDRVRLNGGVRYLPKTDGKRNDLFERVFVTFSPTFEETLPTIANPPAKRGREAGTRLWQESWGPRDYATEHERSKRLRAYGIDRLTQCNHEITWRDGGESFTFRTRAAPGKGGDQALRDYVSKQRSLGWRSGLYTNYTDYAPVNEYWDEDMVMRRSSGDLVTAWPRCYSPKALFAVEMDRKLAPLIQKKYGTNAAYTDVHTSVSPWDRADYDARVPGAGTFAA
ncbi:hypothetical protein FJY63_04545, partial [Candidatus Sumerlaeota bacterium]|nr:hypothetical protein [Candidatus Sumerlaeota bacterium]